MKILISVLLLISCSALAATYEYTAKGRYYKTYLDGVYQTQHTTEREAIEQSNRLARENPGATVTYKHEYEVDVRITSVPVVIEPPSSPPASSDPHAHFDYLSALPEIETAVELRSEADIDTYHFGPRENSDVEYDATEEATAWPAVNEGHVESYFHGQVHVPVTANDNGTQLFMWERKWHEDYNTHANHGTGNNWTGARKEFQFEGTNAEKQTITILFAYAGTSQETKAGRNPTNGAEAFFFATLDNQGSWPGGDTSVWEFGAGDGNDLFVVGGRWYRFWCFWDFGNNLQHFWAANEVDQTVVRLSPSAGIPVSSGSEQRVRKFDFENNISNTPNPLGSGTTTMWSRNFAHLTGLTLSEVQSILADATATQF